MQAYQVLSALTWEKYGERTELSEPGVSEWTQQTDRRKPPERSAENFPLQFLIEACTEATWASFWDKEINTIVTIL